MPVSGSKLWSRFCETLVEDPDLGIAVDPSRAGLEPADLDRLRPLVEQALEAMHGLERGAIANPGEGRMVGHYWLRAPDLAPDAGVAASIEKTLADIRGFAARVHGGEIAGRGGAFRHLLHIGIGGSALGPQFVAEALGGDAGGLTPVFMDNTDPDGFDRTLRSLEGVLDRTLVTVVSKSGGTPEPRNGMLETRAAFDAAGVDHAGHFVAVTMEGSRLDREAQDEGWLARFPMWDWVGGRTSVTSAVGLLPAALQGIDVEALLGGAAAMDRWTREPDPARNPAAILAMAWHHAGGGRGARDMVVLPYKDRLVLLGRYLQQLVMESIGKERDRSGTVVHQGLAVYGNKGSTDQHAYVQQLRDGLDNFFVTFIEVLRDRAGPSLEVEPGVTAGDYLYGFLHGTRRALHESGRASITIAIESLTPSTLGALIALYERAVGLYAELIDVNAYDQPGVEAGKRAAAAALDLQRRALETLAGASGTMTAEAIAAAMRAPDETETVYRILRHLAANPGRGVEMTAAASPRDTRFGYSGAAAR